MHAVSKLSKKDSLTSSQTPQVGCASVRFSSEIRTHNSHIFSQINGKKTWTNNQTTPQKYETGSHLIMEQAQPFFSNSNVQYFYTFLVLFVKNENGEVPLNKFYAWRWLKLRHLCECLNFLENCNKNQHQRSSYCIYMHKHKRNVLHGLTGKNNLIVVMHAHTDNVIIIV